MDGRPKNLEEAKREYGSIPTALHPSESVALQAIEKAKELAEEQRRRRLAAQDVSAETIYSKMQQRLSIQK